MIIKTDKGDIEFNGGESMTPEPRDLTERRVEAIGEWIDARDVFRGRLETTSSLALELIAADPATPILAEAVKVLKETAAALENVTAEAQAWRDGLNTRGAMKNLNNAKVGCVFVAFGLAESRRKAEAAKALLSRLREVGA